MNVIKEIQKLNKFELESGLSGKSSWHDQYKDSAYLYVGGLPYQLTEGDIICVFSQYGEIVDVDLIRDKATGKSKGFAFLAYEDQRSTVLAVDNLNGIQILGRTIRVDHVSKDKYKPRRTLDDGWDEEKELERRKQILPSHLLPPEATKESKKKRHARSDDDSESVKKDKKKKKKKDKKVKRHSDEELDLEDPMREYILSTSQKKKKKKDKE